MEPEQRPPPCEASVPGLWRCLIFKLDEVGGTRASRSVQVG